jgi:hypothetical protein
MPSREELRLARAKALTALDYGDWRDLDDYDKGTCLERAIAIEPADAARAVTDEEVVTESVISAVAREIWMNGGPDLATHHAAAGARGMLAALHAAGFKVVRG